MLWVGVWVVLVVAAAALLGWLGWRVVRKGLALLAEVGSAADAVAQVQSRMRAEAGRLTSVAPGDPAHTDVTGQQREPLSVYGPTMAVPASERSS